MKLQDIDVSNKIILLRVDYNVALADGKVVEPKRIAATIPTLKWLLERNAKLIVFSHLGRPRGTWNLKYSMKPVLECLESALKKSGIAFNKCLLWDKPYPSAELTQKAAGLKAGDILLLENLRFSPAEEKNDQEFAKGLAALGDIFVEEAFGALHRAHASVEALPRLMSVKTFGFLVEKELDVLGRLLSNPPKPFVVLLGGVKASDKLAAVENLLARGVDKILVGGALAYTFLKSQGVGIGKSPFENDWVAKVGELLAKQNGGKRLLVSHDHWIVEELAEPQAAKTTVSSAIPDGWGGVDVGPKTLEVFSRELETAKTIFWNGPVGVIETSPFDKGSSELAKLIALRTKSGCLTVLGGGDTIYAVNRAGLNESEFSHVSTGGGATLEFLEGRTLPGVAAISY
ncbi:MAG: phosphoglycerate kinase [Elusimicrobia bacterium]|nr:phosphoglycerate kinase [Elusimicrobiota bacterium]